MINSVKAASYIISKGVSLSFPINLRQSSFCEISLALSFKIFLKLEWAREDPPRELNFECLDLLLGLLFVALALSTSSYF